jgi:uncharacterized protein (DUF2236 family)
MPAPQLRSLRDYRTFLQSEAAKTENPNAGFFGPGSMAWRLNGEAVLGLVVLRALFMQVAHPAVAQGVADHSDFQQHPFARALATLRAQQAIVFGTCQQSMDALIRIYARHTQVVGRVGDSEYKANDPELLFWVYATLIDSMIYAYQAFLPDLTVTEWDCFYEEGKYFAHLFGIPAELVPPDRMAFVRWMAAKLASDEIHVTPVAREIGNSLLSMPVRFAWPLTTLLAAGSLPPSLRADFGLPWSPSRLRIYEWSARLLRFAFRWLPGFLHTSPAYWLARRRAFADR